ncbi:MAG TPA: methionine--tRNA ligase [Candidatus Scatosoma pullistercoris]|uniref:Methionine--tRNA ligase n=1 Tax=Candidatus Scatosoma pullistercoris TaxID=2840934 RepID=A0A9D1SGC5_9FIRM|nr:methionine--tRNA ligase [Candidatus Scatosoma pullistercoris]
MDNQTKKPYYITTAIAYTSGKPHIGNTYEAVLADAIARFKRKEGYDVFFQTGTDEHGQKIEEKAEKAGVTPKQYVDKVAGEIRQIWDLMGTSYDKFIRTTDPEHERTVAKIFQKFYDRGDIYKGCYEGMYCTPCESFWTESQLVDGKCPDCGREVKPAKEEAYFFRMGKYADRLIEHINTHPEFIQPVSRKNEMMNNFLLKGLQDLCVSRTSFSWGIPVPFDKKHVVYVWLDALTNYITGLGYDPDGNSGENYKKYWPADLHLIGKDIIRFHTIYWPIFLMALGEPLPKQVFGHPWLLQGDGKMSKSKGNVIYADDLVRLFGVDAVRYFVLHEMPFDNDGVISWELVAERYNTELANVLGNLVSRTVAMISKYFGGTVTRPSSHGEGPDENFREFVTGTVSRVRARADELRVADALTEIFALFRRANKYIDETMPWALAKEESKKERLNDVLYNLAEAIQTGASLLDSFMPDTSAKILAAFGGADRSLEECARFGLAERVTVTPVSALFARIDFKALEPEIEKIREAQRAEAAAETAGTANTAGAKGQAEPSGQAATETQAAAAKKSGIKIAKATPAGTADTVAPAVSGTEKKDAAQAEGGTAEEEKAEEISIEDFAKVRLQVGEIVACEKVPKSSKLLHETVKFGAETRSVVSGIGKHYKPEELVGKKVVFVTNLKPVTLCGVLSEGMILAAEDENGKLALVVPDDSALESGAKIG